MKCQIIDSGILSAVEIMAKDAMLLDQLDPDDPPLLHLYEWKDPSLTYGYFIKPERYLHLDQIEKYGITMARRPTGGGIIFHLTDFAFSVLLPANHLSFSLNTLDNYALINHAVAKIISHFSNHQLKPDLLVEEKDNKNKNYQAFCMAKPTQYDLMIQGKKVGGAAQRRTKRGFLHQASISLAFPPKEILNEIFKDIEILKAMESQSYYLLSENVSNQELNEARDIFKKILNICFK